jgi:hypothetical protein
MPVISGKIPPGAVAVSLSLGVPAWKLGLKKLP